MGGGVGNSLRVAAPFEDPLKDSSVQVKIKSSEIIVNN